jgi:hypothetical protein
LIGCGQTACAAASPARADAPAPEQGGDVLSWLLWRLERIERIHAVARLLVKEFGVEAGGEARRRELGANSAETARDWRRVASVISRRTPKSAPLDAPISSALPEIGSAADSKWIAEDPPQVFRIQFVCRTSERGSANLSEKHIEAKDASAAIVAAAKAKWPPRTIKLRILDREGREVFAREKANRR